MIFHGWGARRHPCGSKLCIKPRGTRLPFCSESEPYRGSDPALRSKNASMSGALILFGGPGSGNSSVLDALSTMLEIDQSGSERSRQNSWHEAGRG
jgi:hypothetical protein